MSLGGRQFVGSSVERDRCVPDILILASSARDAICSNGRSGLTPRSVARAERRYCWPSFYSPFDTRVRYQLSFRYAGPVSATSPQGPFASFLQVLRPVIPYAVNRFQYVRLKRTILDRVPLVKAFWDLRSMQPSEWARL